MVELTRMLHMLKRTTDHFVTFTKFVHDYPENPEGPEDPCAPENLSAKSLDRDLTDSRRSCKDDKIRKKIVEVGFLQ